MQIAEISEFYQKLGLTKTMLTSDFWPEVNFGCVVWIYLAISNLQFENNEMCWSCLYHESKSIMSSGVTRGQAAGGRLSRVTPFRGVTRGQAAGGRLSRVTPFRGMTPWWKSKFFLREFTKGTGETGLNGESHSWYRRNDFLEGGEGGSGDDD